MGYYKDEAIENQQMEAAQADYEHDQAEEEFYLFHTINAFSDLLGKYGIEAIIKFWTPEQRFDMLEAIIKSQGNTRV